MLTTLRHPVPRVAARWAIRTAHLVPLLTLPAAIWRVPLAFGFSMGMLHDGVPMHATGGEAVYILALAVISEAVALLTLGLVRPWGEVVPAWIPLLRRRIIPSSIVVVMAITGALALTAICVFAHVNLLMLGTADFVNGWWLALTAAAYLPLLSWGPLVLVLALAYRRRRALS